MTFITIGLVIALIFNHFTAKNLRSEREFYKEQAIKAMGGNNKGYRIVIENELNRRSMMQSKSK